MSCAPVVSMTGGDQVVVLAMGGSTVVLPEVTAQIVVVPQPRERGAVMPDTAVPAVVSGGSSAGCSAVAVDEQQVIVLSDTPQPVVVEPDGEQLVVTACEQGPPGPPGDQTLLQVGTEQISGHTAVALDAQGLLRCADCSVAAPFGLALGLVAQAYEAGAMAAVQTWQVVEHSAWSWTPGPVFVGLAGQLVQVLPPQAVFMQVVGFALAATRLRVAVQPPILLM